MPRSAIATGCVDFVLPPAGIAREIVRIARHPYVARGTPPRSTGPPGEPDLGNVLEIVRDVAGVDFTRLQGQHPLPPHHPPHDPAQDRTDARTTCGSCARAPTEVEALYQDVLIRVTRFFRDPETFEALKSQVLPKLFKDRSRHEPMRVWVLGCSTGEEAYSLAIAFAEFAETRGSSLPDPDLRHRPERSGHRESPRGHLLEEHRARRLAGAPAALLRGGGRQLPDQQDDPRHVRVRPAQRADRPALLADRPDQLPQPAHLPGAGAATEGRADPPLRPEAGRLPPAGQASETIGSYRDLFEVVDAKHKIYAKKPSARRVAFGQSPAVPRAAGRQPGRGPGRPQPAGRDVQKEADRILLARYAPPGVLVNADLEILQFRGDTGPYLAPAPGKASLSLLRMAREGWRAALRAAINKARKEDAPVREEGLRLEFRGRRPGRSHLRWFPSRGSPAGEGGFLVLFEEPPGLSPAGTRARRKAARPQAGPRRARRSPNGERPPDAGADRDPRVPAVGDRAAGGRQRGAAVRQRGGAVGQRGAAEHQRGAGDLQGGDPVEQRGAGHGQRRAPEPQRRAEPAQQRPVQPPRQHPDGHRDPRAEPAHPALHADGGEDPQPDPLRRRPADRRLKLNLDLPDLERLAGRGDRHGQHQELRGPGPARPLVLAARPPLQDPGEQDRRRGDHAGRRRHAAARRANTPRASSPRCASPSSCWTRTCACRPRARRSTAPSR